MTFWGETQSSHHSKKVRYTSIDLLKCCCETGLNNVKCDLYVIMKEHNGSNFQEKTGDFTKKKNCTIPNHKDGPIDYFR